MGKAFPDGYTFVGSGQATRSFDREKDKDFELTVEVSGYADAIRVPPQPRLIEEESQPLRTLTGIVKVNPNRLQNGSAWINLDDLSKAGDGIFLDVYKAGKGNFNANPAFHVSPMMFVVGDIRAFFTVHGTLEGRLLRVMWDCSVRPPEYNQSEVRMIRFLVIG